MSYEDALKKQRQEEANLRKVLGSRSGLRGRKSKRDPISSSKMPDIPVTAENDTPLWTSQIKESSLPAPLPPKPIQKNLQPQTQRLPANAEKALIDLTKQLRKAHGLDTDGDA